MIRPYSHSQSDNEVAYRPAEEREEEATRDPIVTFPARLIQDGVATEEEIAAIKTEVEDEVQLATDLALASPQPGPETIMRNVYSEEVDPTGEHFDTEDDPQFSGNPTTMVDLLNACMSL